RYVSGCVRDGSHRMVESHVGSGNLLQEYLRLT
ncbi:unnamed protein product, partial [marine sediment metagenome]